MQTERLRLRGNCFSRFAAVLALAILVGALLLPTAAEAKKLNVVTSTTDLASLTQEVGGDNVNVESIAKGYQDPHFVEAKPSFLLKLRQADLLIAVGLQLEIGWLPPLITQSGNPKIQIGGPGYLDASQFAEILDIPQGNLTRAEGDVHPMGNPHYWLDPNNGRPSREALPPNWRTWIPRMARTFSSASRILRNGCWLRNRNGMRR